MPRNAIAVLLGLLSLLGVCLAATNAKAQLTEPYVSRATGISFPIELGGLRLIRTTDFEPRQRGLGVGVYYNHQAPFVAIDIFIYDKTDVVPSGHEPPLVKAEAAQAIADIHTVAASGLYADVLVLSGPTSCRAGGVLYQCASLEFTRTPQGQPPVPTRSLLLIRGEKGNFFKVRASWPQAQHEQAGPVVDRWLEAFNKLLPAN